MIRTSFTKLSHAYKQQLTANPLRTKMATSACLFSFGDFICQKTESSYKKKCEQKRELLNTATKTESSMLTTDWNV